jgi:sugar (pentulose or hexulose) kinase
MDNKLHIGIDVGTQNIRFFITDTLFSDYKLLKFPLTIVNQSCKTDSQVLEQDTLEWKTGFDKSIEFFSQISINGLNPNDISTISIDGTSGTIIPVDKKGTPLMNAIMYNDKRSESEAHQLNKLECICTHCKEHGYTFSSSFALPKILWVKNNFPDIYERTYKFFSPTDLFNFWLIRNINIPTDYSNALKTGYNLINETWPEFINKELGIDRKKLPNVVPTGSKIGTLNDSIFNQYSYHPKSKIIAGCTDGTASIIASGSSELGDKLFVIGTTLVAKAITDTLIIDEKYGRLYCHKHPSGYWIPGGASNVGTTWIKCNFEGLNIEEMDHAANKLCPTNVILYPLEGKGERFPILNSNAKKFCYYVNLENKISKKIDLDSLSKIESYSAHLEGVGYVIRSINDLYTEFDVPNISDKIYITGGATKSNDWMQIIANITNKIVYIPKVTESAFCGVILGISYMDRSQDISEISKRLNPPERIFQPDPVNAKKYNMLYRYFEDIIKKEIPNSLD